MKKRAGIFALLLILILTGCRPVLGNNPGSLDSEGGSPSVGRPSAPVPEKEEKTFIFRDVRGNVYTAVLNEAVAPSPYDITKFNALGHHMEYEDEDYETSLGVDVSYHQGRINWQEVADSGMEFAIIRIGFRGYGKTGSLNEDREFRRNLAGAKAAGLKVGIYFFAQAINEEEAVEEAEYVLSLLGEEDLDLEIVYDPESILGDEARTDGVTGEQFTKNTRAFCDRIREAGFKPMVYANMMWEAFMLDLSMLSDIPVWYADYEVRPQTPYDFTMWQYTCEGRVAGIDGDVDINIRLERR